MYLPEEILVYNNGNGGISEIGYDDLSGELVIGDKYKTHNASFDIDGFYQQWKLGDNARKILRFKNTPVVPKVFLCPSINSSQTNVVIQDPRGFCITLSYSSWCKFQIANRVVVDKNGWLECYICYSFSPERDSIIVNRNRLNYHYYHISLTYISRESMEDELIPPAYYLKGISKLMRDYKKSNTLIPGKIYIYWDNSDIDMFSEAVYLRKYRFADGPLENPTERYRLIHCFCNKPRPGEYPRFIYSLSLNQIEYQNLEESLENEKEFLEEVEFRFMNSPNSYVFWKTPCIVSDIRIIESELFKLDPCQVIDHQAMMGYLDYKYYIALNIDAIPPKCAEIEINLEGTLSIKEIETTDKINKSYKRDGTLNNSRCDYFMCPMITSDFEYVFLNLYGFIKDYYKHSKGVWELPLKRNECDKDIQSAIEICESEYLNNKKQ